MPKLPRKEFKKPPEPIRRCAWCSVRFVPTHAQLGQEKRGRKLYCSDAHQAEADRERARKWWRSDEGRAYGRERYAQRQKGDAR